MRFDDMLATVLAQPTPDARAVVLQWRQIVDLVAQRRDAANSPQLEAAYALLGAARARLPVGERVAAARSLSGQRLPARLVAVFANDHAAVAAPVMRGVRLRPAEWIDLMPALGPTARALLRHREDLDPDVKRALEGFGASDLVIEGEIGPAAPAETPREPTGSQIREMVARIEAFRQNRETRPAAEDEAGDGDSFRWECGVDGVLAWSEGAEPAGLVGHVLALAAGGSEPGVEAAVVAAFAGRRGFRDLKLRTAAGEDWRISGVPLFEGASGRFLGFRGTGRRPGAHEREAPAPGGMMGTALPAVAMREMVHELRTPLNAIIGFAELIDGQFLGPAGQRQRARAGDIRDQAQRLVRALEDLDLAAKLDDGRAEVGTGSVDMVALVVRLHDAFETMALDRGVTLAVEIVPDLPPAVIDPDAAERLVSRLLHATVGVAGTGETVGARLLARNRDPNGGVVLVLDRPQAIRGEGAEAMLDPGYAPAIDMSGAPALGLGFALRLVRNLARSVGGDLVIEPHAFVLSLPSRARDEGVGGRQG
ncbi:MAG TPA: HAMP domain-containing sensor histidine kinase [Sphingomonadaceae bacterium]|nr:HAMP domain-containing sensor histidine kinase [Sphingomonadaceae bacterium]